MYIHRCTSSSSSSHFHLLSTSLLCSPFALLILFSPLLLSSPFSPRKRLFLPTWTTSGRSGCRPSSFCASWDCQVRRRKNTRKWWKRCILVGNLVSLCLYLTLDGRQNEGKWWSPLSLLMLSKIHFFSSFLIFFHLTFPSFNLMTP